MAPYIGLMQELTSEEKQLVVMFLTEPKEEPKVDVVEQVRRKYGVAESESTKWFREHAKAVHEWDRQEAWNRLTDKQREEATRLNLTAEDMDERTVAIIEKHLR
ncbi:MAG: hypothetical protein IJV33_05450 [Bacteroidaceae bacterium]|nr:hypothetical protein [Bacteroidaceae bacterium]